MARHNFLTVTAMVSIAAALTPSESPEVHPELTTFRCTLADGCVAATNYIVADALSVHNVHQLQNSSLNCGDWGEGPSEDVCPDKETCHKNCIIEGMDIAGYNDAGIFTNGTELRLLKIDAEGDIKDPRVYLLAENDEEYEMLYLNGMEFSFDVNMEDLPCGMNAALYTGEMEADGGRSDLNPTGARYGNGYCDAQCYTYPFINGEANMDKKGSCCSEMDIWEANSRAVHVAPHTCNETGLYQCSGDECGRDGVCDEPGCAQNPYRSGNKEYYGRGEDYTVDTTKPFTVVTQFVKANGSDVMDRIVRYYVQAGEVIPMIDANRTGVPEVPYIDDEYCGAEVIKADNYMRLGGTAGMGESLDRGAVIAMSLWWDTTGNMTWLDGIDQDPPRGPCEAGEGNPTFVEQVEPMPQVIFSNLRWGEIGSTFDSNGMPQASVTGGCTRGV